MGGDSLFALGEVRREREIPWDIEEAVDKSTPQALLRDLHRPTERFTVAPYEFETVRIIRPDAGVEETAATRRTLLASYKVPVEALLHTSADMHAAMRDLRAVLKKPWTDAPKLADPRGDRMAASYFDKG